MKTSLNTVHSLIHTVLVVDDDTQFVKYLTKLLEYKGYKVYTAFDGVEGMIQYAKYLPDLIITDIFMPEKEGLGLIMEIREKDLVTPIIVISGGDNCSGGTYLSAAKYFGANATFKKPFSEEKILATIAELVSVYKQSL